MTHPLEQLLRIAGDNDRESEVSYPQREAQRDTLLQLLTAANQQRMFTRGDFVRYVPAAGTLNKKATAELQMMFWRYLSDDDEDNARIDGCGTLDLLSSIDCLVAVYTGEAVRFTVAASELLEIDDAPVTPHKLGKVS